MFFTSFSYVLLPPPWSRILRRRSSFSGTVSGRVRISFPPGLLPSATRRDALSEQRGHRALHDVFDKGELPVYRAYQTNADERLLREFTILRLSLGGSPLPLHCEVWRRSPGTLRPAAGLLGVRGLPQIGRRCHCPEPRGTSSGRSLASRVLPCRGAAMHATPENVQADATRALADAVALLLRRRGLRFPKSVSSNLGHSPTPTAPCSSMTGT